MDSDAPAQSHRIARKLIPKFMQPFLRGTRKRFFNSNRPKEEPYRAVYPYTLVHLARQKSLLDFARDIDERSIPGAIVECGVLDGGTAALMAYGTCKSGREIHLFDSWQGLPDATEKDGQGSNVWAGDAVGSQARVRRVMRRLNIRPERVKFHKGWFDETFQNANINEIALLHIDADFYESVCLSIDTWFPKLSPGGYIQFDDYSGFVGCKRAVDEFLSVHPELKLENKGSVVFFIRTPSP